MSLAKIILPFIFISVVSCDNKTNVMDSKKSIHEETLQIEEEKIGHNNSIDSLNIEIENLSDDKKLLQKEKEYAEAEVYNILKKSYLDQVIIGINNSGNSRAFFESKLGFSTKDGIKHSNSISVFFIEFADGSEIELVPLTRFDDKLTKEYKSLLKNKQFGFQFAIRTSYIKELQNHFSTLSSDFMNTYKNDFYSTLSKNRIDPKLPIFFIQYHQQNFNTKTNHKNKSIGISAVWLTTKNLRESIRNFSDIGFILIDTISVANITNKTALIKNDNFELILIEDSNYKLSGVTIRTTDIVLIKNMINTNFNIVLKIRTSKRGKSIYLSPQITNSIWFEFLEN